MNPFDWQGSEFLLFYIVFGAAVLVAQFWRKRIREEKTEGGAVDLSDAYQMAYLKGREAGLCRAAIASLMSEKKLVSDPDSKIVVSPVVPPVNKLEMSVMEAFTKPVDPAGAVSAVCTSPEFQSQASSYKRGAEDAGLLPGPKIRSARYSDAMLSIALLCGVASVKIALAISRGRSNFLLLVFLMFVGCAIAAVISRGRQTTAGKRTLADLNQLYAGMPARVQGADASSLSSREIAMTAGLFGLGVLGASALYGAPLYQGMTMDPMLRSSRHAGTDSGCGSSCGSSSDSSSSCSSSSSDSSSSSSCSSGSSCSGGSSCGGCSSS